jgi:hypothetical protein
VSDQFTMRKKPSSKFPCLPSSEDWCWLEGSLCLGRREAKGMAEVLDLGTEGDKATTVESCTIDGGVGSQLTLRTVKLSECNSDHGGQR